MIEERMEDIISDLELFDDDLEKYEYIVDLGKALSPLDNGLREDQYLVKGCTSKVWLLCEFKNGRLHYTADSNSVIVKGLISILIKIFQDLEPEDVISFDTEILRKFKLNEIISPTRQNGVFHMVNRIKYYAEFYRGTI